MTRRRRRATTEHPGDRATTGVVNSSAAPVSPERSDATEPSAAEPSTAEPAAVASQPGPQPTRLESGLRVGGEVNLMHSLLRELERCEKMGQHRDAAILAFGAGLVRLLQWERSQPPDANIRTRSRVLDLAHKWENSIANRTHKVVATLIGVDAMNARIDLAQQVNLQVNVAAPSVGAQGDDPLANQGYKDVGDQRAALLNQLAVLRSGISLSQEKSQ